MHTRRLLPTAIAVLLLVVAPPTGAAALRPDEGGAASRAQPPAMQAPGVALDPAAARGAGHQEPRAGPPAADPASALSGQVAPTPRSATTPQPSTRRRWQWPLSPRPVVLRRFAPPATTWGAGHRGIDLAATPGEPVLAVASGAVSHVGVIAGKPTISVLHADGIRSTYEPVGASVRTGESVEAGQTIGLVESAGSHCTSTCLHLGAIRGAEYLDPLLLLGGWRVRLLPLHGPPARGP